MRLEEQKIRKKIRVLITATGGGGVGRQVLKALLMTKTPYRLIGADIQPLALGLYQADAGYLVPTAKDPKYVKTLREICLKEKVDVLIPCSDPELLTISQNEDKLAEIGVKLLINPPEVIQTCIDKWKTFNFLKSNNFDCPETCLIQHESDVAKVDFFPVIIKPAKGSGGSKNVFLAQEKEELTFFARYIRRQGYMPLVQEYAGSHEDEYTVGVLTLDKGEIIGSIALKRNITSTLSKKIKVKSHKNSEVYVVSTGISQGVVDDFTEIRKYCESIARKLGARGPVNIQGRKVKDSFKSFEINPRFSGTTSIRALLNFNEPDILIRYYVLGEKPPKIEFKKGFVMRGLSEFYIPFSKIMKKEKVIS